MLTFNAARRRRARRTLLAAALAACALPAAAQAGIVDETSDGSLRLRGEGGESDLVSVRSNNGSVEIQDLAGVTSRTPLCAQLSDLRVRCALGIPIKEVQLGAGNDIIAVDVPNRVVVDGGFDNDALDGGKTAGPSRVTFVGGAGRDVASYSTTDRAVRVSGSAFDGRIGLDEDVIGTDVERIVGSRFGDQLTSVNSFSSLSGGPGDDVLTGSSAAGAITTYDMGRRADGGDRIVPGANVSFVDYSQRTLPVGATIGFGGADDGEAGERDEIRAASAIGLYVHGGAAGDTIRVAPGSRVGVGVVGNGGNDTLEGGEGIDFIDGGLGADTLLANGGDDQLRSNDGVSDVVGCGTGDDNAILDSRDGFTGCENRSVVGALRLAAQAGEPARMRLSWRHPRSWRELRSIEVRLVRDGLPVGAVTIRPRGERIAADGLVELVRRGTRLTRKGKAVTARLALRVDERLAGARLRIEVEATDSRGRRQLEPDAGTLRVAR